MEDFKSRSPPPGWFIRKLGRMFDSSVEEDEAGLVEQAPNGFKATNEREDGRGEKSAGVGHHERDMPPQPSSPESLRGAAAGPPYCY